MRIKSLPRPSYLQKATRSVVDWRADLEDVDGDMKGEEEKAWLQVTKD